MNVVVNNSALLLDRLQTVELIDAAGTTAALDKGCVWITMDGDRRDIVLGAGESWTIERNGRTLVQAGARSEMRLSAPAHEDKWRARRKTLMAAFNHWVEQRYARAQVPLY